MSDPSATKPDPPRQDNLANNVGDAALNSNKRKSGTIIQNSIIKSDHPSKRSALEHPNIVNQGAASPRESRQTQHSHVSNSQQGNASAGDTHNEVMLTTAAEIVGKYFPLKPISALRAKLDPLSVRELAELEDALDIGVAGGWRDDWVGNLAFLDEEVFNPYNRTKDKRSFKQSLLAWAENNDTMTRLVHNVFRYVFNMVETPRTAKKILLAANPNSAESLEQAHRRTNYDPQVLAEDGWTVVKSKEPQGASGGPFAIGERIIWEGSPAIVIAFLHDEDIGDLWKAIWIDEESCRSFDLETEELIEARRKYERSKSKISDIETRKSLRREVDRDFTVKGIETGIVLAQSFQRGSRPGVLWPARIRHASELIHAVGSKRNMAKQKVEVVFLAPYWNATDVPHKGGRVDGLSENHEAHFNSTPLFSIEMVDVDEQSIKEYPFDFETDLNIDELRVSFRFTGLPKGIFSRFLDSNRLAVAFRSFAVNHLDTKRSAADLSMAGLFEAHPIALRTAEFPTAVIALPYEFLLPHLPQRDHKKAAVLSDYEYEPIIQIRELLNSFKPPRCWGRVGSENGNPSTPNKKPRPDIVSPKGLTLNIETKDMPLEVIATEVLREYVSLRRWIELCQEQPATLSFLHHVGRFVAVNNPLSSPIPFRSMQRLVQGWSSLKGIGENSVALSYPSQGDVVKTDALADWRKASEKLYMLALRNCATQIGGVSYLFTDLRCNGHRTSGGGFERSVRLPAAIKAARRVGLDESLILHVGIDDDILNFVEEKVLPLAHSSRYLQKMKSRCLSALNDEVNIPLTEDSDGSGGEDTVGSRGSWTAAVTAVSAAITAVNKVMCGEGVNAFCITRPPGHHAGRTLHPMNAVSNGFCVLNAVACAALYATTPAPEGGYGLRRVCVIDIDAHHGNGTEDILCSTYDPRFLYISLHAGGSEVNCSPAEADDPGHELHDLAGKAVGGGIFPGRCGDTSPHAGVLNIPLGSVVMPNRVGTALVKQVKPAINKFAPELIIMSTGFDAHKNDPMCLGGLSAQDFGFITEFVCQLANRLCSGRVVSVLEGGYGVPCCRPQRDDVFLPSPDMSTITAPHPRPQPSRILDLGRDIPDDMDDQVPSALQRRLEKCHAEGFMDCVEEHIKALKNCNRREF